MDRHLPAVHSWENNCLCSKQTERAAWEVLDLGSGQVRACVYRWGLPVTKGPGGWAWNADTREGLRGCFGPFPAHLYPEFWLLQLLKPPPTFLMGDGGKHRFASSLRESQVGCWGLLGFQLPSVGALVLARSQSPRELKQNKTNS